MVLGILAAYGAYLLATISPGPANLAIMATAMRSGRCGARIIITWSVLAAAGLSALLATYGNVTTYIRLAGRAYLLWLAYKSFKSALRAQVKPSRAKVSGAGASGSYMTGWVTRSR